MNCCDCGANSPLAYMDPLSTNLTHMFCEMYQDALTEYTYAAELAGLGYNINNTIYGLTVSLILVFTIFHPLHFLGRLF